MTEQMNTEARPCSGYDLLVLFRQAARQMARPQHGPRCRHGHRDEHHGGRDGHDHHEGHDGHHGHHGHHHAEHEQHHGEGHEHNASCFRPEGAEGRSCRGRHGRPEAHELRGGQGPHGPHEHHGRGQHEHHGHGRHAQRQILSILHERGPMGQRDLMDLLQVRSASLSELLAKLERHEMVQRKRDPQDRRGFTVGLTEEGRAAARAQEEDLQQSAERFFAPLDAAERAQLAALLSKLAAAPAETADEAECRFERRAPYGRGGRHGFAGPETREAHGPRGEAFGQHGRERHSGSDED